MCVSLGARTCVCVSPRHVSVRTLPLPAVSMEDIQMYQQRLADAFAMSVGERGMITPTTTLGGSEDVRRRPRSRSQLDDSRRHVVNPDVLYHEGIGVRERSRSRSRRRRHLRPHPAAVARAASMERYPPAVPLQWSRLGEVWTPPGFPDHYSPVVRVCERVVVVVARSRWTTARPARHQAAARTGTGLAAQSRLGMTGTMVAERRDLFHAADRTPLPALTRTPVIRCTHPAGRSGPSTSDPSTLRCTAGGGTAGSATCSVVCPLQLARACVNLGLSC